MVISLSSNQRHQHSSLLSFTQGLSLVSGWKVQKLNLAQSLLSGCLCIMAPVATSSTYLQLVWSLLNGDYCPLGCTSKSVLLLEPFWTDLKNDLLSGKIGAQDASGKPGNEFTGVQLIEICSLGKICCLYVVSIKNRFWLYRVCFITSSLEK